MFLLRNHPKGARFASFGIGLCIFALMPRETGYQDIASLLARQPGVAERWQKQVFSAASSIQLATYSFSRPIGTSVPQSAMVRLASLDGREVTGAISRNPALQAPPRYQAADFPKVDRSMKGDRLATITPTQAPEAGAPGFERWLIGHAVELGAAGMDVSSLRQTQLSLAVEQRRRSNDCIRRWLSDLG